MRALPAGPREVGVSRHDGATVRNSPLTATALDDLTLPAPPSGPSTRIPADLPRGGAVGGPSFRRRLWFKDEADAVIAAPKQRR